MEFRAVNSVVGGHMDVNGILAELQLLLLRHAAEIVFAVVKSHMGAADFFSFLQRFLGPGTCYDIICSAAFRQKVHGHHGKLGAGAALEEQDAVIVAESQQLFDVGFDLYHDIVEGFGSVADFQYRHPGTAEIQQFLFGPFQNIFGDHGGACVKIIYLAHKEAPFLFMEVKTRILIL